MIVDLFIDIINQNFGLLLVGSEAAYWLTVQALEPNCLGSSSVHSTS